MPNKYCNCKRCTDFSTEDIDRLRYITVMTTVFDNFRVAHIIRAMLGPQAPIDDVIGELGPIFGKVWGDELAEMRKRMKHA